MQLFTLGFDDGITFREVKERCDGMGIPIAFAYHTFRSSCEKGKFRVVFTYGHPVEDLFVIKLILLILHGLFPKYDNFCSNPDRMFYGGKGQYYPIEEASRCLKENIEEALYSNRLGIHLMKAQTGLRKIRAYVYLVQEHPEMKFLVALPTNKVGLHSLPAFRFSM